MQESAKMRVLIVEDRPLARNELKYLLSLHPDVEVVAECEDTASAWVLIQAGNIDGVFLDIDIETESQRAGLDLAVRIDRLGLPKTPWIVFTTGFDEWALEAIQVRPFGYLVKPLGDAQLAQVLDKIRISERDVSPLKRRLISVRYRKSIQGELMACTRYISPEEIVYVQAENGADYVRVKLVQGEKLDGVSVSLAKWESHVPELRRIHKSHLVNLQHVNGLQPDPFRVEGCNVTFTACAELLAVGRNHLKALQQDLEGRCQ